MVLDCSSQVLEHSYKDMEPSGYTLPPLSEALMGGKILYIVYAKVML
jgi:hypothetical protein